MEFLEFAVLIFLALKEAPFLENTRSVLLAYILIVIYDSLEDCEYFLERRSNNSFGPGRVEQ